MPHSASNPSDSTHPRLTPSPRGTVIPRYWGDGSRFGGKTEAHWSYRKPQRRHGRGKTLWEAALRAL